jgi:hypothetical protein
LNVSLHNFTISLQFVDDEDETTELTPTGGQPSSRSPTSPNDLLNPNSHSTITTDINKPDTPEFKSPPAKLQKTSSFTLPEPIETTQQFFNWFSLIEDEMEKGQEDIYLSHLATLRSYQQACDDLLDYITSAQNHLASQTEHYNFVSSKTQSLQGACEELLDEQTRLAELADEVDLRLRKFDVLEPAVKLFGSSGDNVCLDDEFIPLLARLDDSLEFVSTNVREAFENLDIGGKKG